MIAHWTEAVLAGIGTGMGFVRCARGVKTIAWWSAKKRED